MSSARISTIFGALGASLHQALFPESIAKATAAAAKRSVAVLWSKQRGEFVREEFSSLVQHSMGTPAS
jgi:hypothetical protein